MVAAGRAPGASWVAPHHHPQRFQTCLDCFPAQAIPYLPNLAGSAPFSMDWGELITKQNLFLPPGPAFVALPKHNPCLGLDTLWGKALLKTFRDWQENHQNDWGD